jgi:tryptophan-rich sensory protein
MKEKIKSYAFFILSALAVGGLSAFFTRNNMDINKDVLMPPLSPPPILFPIVWTILFILMGISAARRKQYRLQLVVSGVKGFRFS